MSSGFFGRHIMKHIKALLIIILCVIAIMACSAQTTDWTNSPTSSTTTINLTISSSQDHQSLSPSTLGPTVTMAPADDGTDARTSSPTSTLLPPILTTVPLPATATFPSGMTPTTARYHFSYTIVIPALEDVILDLSTTESVIFELIDYSGMNVHPAFYQISGTNVTLTAIFLSLHQIETYIYYLGTDRGTIQIDLSFVGE